MMEALFGVPPTDTTGGEVSGAGRGGGGLIGPPTIDFLLYWLPAEEAEGLSELRFDPPARHVRRATFVRVDLR
ncbi:MAG: hypothetical protein AAGF12_24945 [Myxococcota bacterium]